MKTSRRLHMTGVGFVGLVLTLSACGGGSSGDSTVLETMADSKTARVALAANPPYSDLGQDGEATGYAPALALAVLADQGVETLEPSVVEFEGLIPGLQANRWDVITTGLSVTKERCGAILFSEPTVVQQETLTVPTGNPNQITSHDYFTENSGATLAVLTGSSQQQYAVETAEVPESQILAVGDPTALADAVISGRADAFAIGQVSAETAIAPHEGDLEIIPLDYIPVYGTAFGFRPADEELRDYFNERMAALHESGELREIFEEWGFTNYDLLAETSLNDLVPDCEQ